MASFICIHCGRLCRYGMGLKRHVRSSYVNQPLFSRDRVDNQQRHMCNCIGRGFFYFIFYGFSFLEKQQVPWLGREISQSHGNPDIYRI